MKTQVTISPWHSPSDLLDLRDAFYHSQSGTTKYTSAEGCQLTQVLAVNGRIPHAVLATAELTQALLDEPKDEIAIETRANTLCTAWVRFVNGMTDSQQRFRSKQSMFVIARQLGLPAAFIELRHRITHEDKPKMNELRSAARKGLSWLYDWYWKHIPIDAEPGADGE